MQQVTDKADRLLLRALQDNARLTSGELAQMAHLSQSPTWRRVKQLEETGTIKGYHAALDRRALGYSVLAFVLIGIDHQNEASSQAFVQAVSEIPEVVQFHAISGQADFLVGLVARDLDHYSELLQRKLHRLPGVRQVQSHFSLQEFKGQMADLPVPLD
ncbi:MAG: Lrp/AsnC family transcriptional regulator [Rhodoferax sp.]|uniref:Lrp/AsnC family transcriptional regulator n=1 Tax=Rhodoferax sp. TaxID=50421 RepID=UPI002ACD8175|nr:Lrp/AsnC family transcriptional regulator [Rhodoferax sp.]MDZ7892762.1 Lrp/AsnC family transcriptional regulator [Rhodoferax sp.]